MTQRVRQAIRWPARCAPAWSRWRWRRRFAAGAQAPSNPTLNAQLLVGARQGDLAQVERVLAAGASPSSRNRLGKTALLLAAEKAISPSSRRC
jgi:hypothetical protein